MPHVLVAGKIHEAGRALLREAPGVTCEFVDEVSMESYAPLVGGADAILIRTQPMPASVIEKAGRLKIVSRHGVGYDSVDVEALNRRGIPLTVVGDVNSRPVAEHVLMMMLALAKRGLRADAATRAGTWGYRNSYESRELAGKTLLIVGFGRIGRIVAKLAAAFEMTILAHDPPLSEADIRAGGVEPAPDLDAALPRADFITIHAPLVGGKPLVGAPELRRMKAGAIVVNTARGGVVDETALAEALDRGGLGGAGLDVFAAEPPAKNNPLLGSAFTMVTPHLAGLTEESAARMAIVSVRNLLDFFSGRLDPGVVVNRGYGLPRRNA